MSGIELAWALANEARRRALVEALLAQPRMSIAELDRLLCSSPYAEELASLTVGQLLQPDPSRAPLRIPEGVPLDVAVLRQFEERPYTWMSSRFFIRSMGLRRWAAQRVLGELVQAGKLERRGTTSNTRYRLAKQSRAGVRGRAKK